jgi:hypothetical protein
MTKEYDLQETIQRMREASNGFYRAATQIGNHAFIEFTGFMNEYIAICEYSRLGGVDFTQTNTHSDRAVRMESYHGDYIGEKFDCIFGPWFRNNPEAWAAFKKKIEGA